MADVAEFEVSVRCVSGSSPHRHVLVVRSTGSLKYGAAKPAQARLQYTCPVTGDAAIASFEPPLHAPRPFKIAEVKDG